MNPQIHTALDDESTVQALPPAERAELATVESQIDAVLRAIPAEPLPDLAPAVLERVRRESSRARAPIASLEPSPARARNANWLWRPHTVNITWRPAYALAAAAVFMAMVATNPLRQRTAVVAKAPQQVFTQFVLTAPAARQVAVAGDFSGWKPVHVMTRSEAGVWTVVVPLDPGVHEYAFVVDGERWVADPTAPPVRDGFGGVNSRLAVLSPDAGRS
jgi:AMP-activated protein kinase-like protein